MSSTQVKVQIQHRIDTAANWTSANPTLLAGELGYESDTKKFKLGDGSTAWTSLAYVPGSGGYTAGTGVSISASNVITASAVALTTVQTAANETAMLALTTQEGDVVVRSDENKSYVRNSGTAGSMADFTLLATPTDAVLSVNGNTGAITAAQIAGAVEAASDSNTFTDADHTKLNGIETAATGDQTASEIVALVADQTIAPSEIDMEDDEKIKLGTDNDLQIYHDGSNSKISDVGTGDLQLLGANVGIYSTGGEPMFVGIANGASELYYDGVKKVQTSSTGITVNGAAVVGGNIEINTDAYLKIGASNDLQIWHNGTNSHIRNNTGDLILDCLSSGVSSRLRPKLGEEGVVTTADGLVALYYDGTKKAETATGGFTVTGVCSATSFSGDGSNLTNLPAAGGSVTLTANGSIAANKPVIVNSSGQAEQVAIDSGSAGAQATFDASASSDGMKVAGNGEGQFLCVNVESGQYKLRSASVSGTTVTFGSESSFNPGQANYGNFDICYVSTKDCYMMVYRGTSDYGYARCIQVSNSGSLTISSQSSALESYGMSEISICFGNNANGWCSVNAQREQGSFRRWLLKTVAPNASNLASAPQVNSGTQFISGYNSLEKFAQAFNVDQGMFYGIFVADGDLKAEAWTVYETGSFGRSGVLDSITSSFNSSGETSLAYDPGTKKIVAGYRNGSNGKMRVINWNGSSWDSVSTYSEHSVGSSPEHIKLIYYAPTSTMLFSYVQSSDGKVIPVTINSHSSFSNGSGFTYESDSVDRPWGAADTTDSKGVLFVYQDSANSNRPRGRFYSPPQTNLDNNFVGFADAAISNGASGTINVIGNTTTQSSLTAGKTYYVQGDGTLSTTADDPIQKAGVALSATSLLIN